MAVVQESARVGQRPFARVRWGIIGALCGLGKRAGIFGKRGLLFGVGVVSVPGRVFAAFGHDSVLAFML